VNSDSDVDFLSNLTTDVTPTWEGLNKLSPMPTPVPTNETIEVKSDSDADFLSNTTSEIPLPVSTNETIEVNSDVPLPIAITVNPTIFPTIMAPTSAPPVPTTYAPTTSYSLSPILASKELEAQDFSALSTEVSDALVSFTATGGFYEDNIDFYTTLKSLGAHKYEFFVYLGGFMSASEGGNCDEATYERFSSILKAYTTIPVLVVPGRDDWQNCADPVNALQTWRSYFTYDFDNYWFKDSSIIERKPGRIEDFSYLHNNVLYVGVRLIKEEGMDYDANQESIDWVKSHTLKYEDRFRMLIVLGDSGSDANTEGFFAQLSQLTENIATPTAYMHSSYKTAVTNNFMGNIILVQVHESNSPFMKVRLYESNVTFQQ